MKSWNLKQWFVLAFSASMLVVAGCNEVTQTSGSDTSSSSGGMNPSPLSLDPQGAVIDTCAPNDGSAVNFTIGVTPSCDPSPNAAQFHFYAYPADTTELAAGQIWSFDMASMGQMGHAQYLPDGIAGNAIQVDSAMVEVKTVGSGTVDVHYEFTLSTGDNYAGEATLVVCTSMPLCG